MKTLAAIVLFCFASCASPLVASVATEGRAAVFFDGSTFVADVEGAATFSLNDKATGLPIVSGATGDQGGVIVSNLESEWTWRGSAAELTPEAVGLILSLGPIGSRYMAGLIQSGRYSEELE